MSHGTPVDRDLANPPFGRTELYSNLADLRSHFEGDDLAMLIS